MKIKICVLLLASLMTTGCRTNLDARRDGSGTYVDRNKVIYRAGVDYALPMLQFRISINRELSQCASKAGDVDIRFQTKITAEPHYVAGERYVIDYLALTNWSKTSKFEIQTYDTGVIKSLNAEAEDQSASILGDVVKTGIGLLSLSSGVPLTNKGPLPPGAPAPVMLKCSTSTEQLLKDRAAAIQDLKTKTTRLTNLNDEISRLERNSGMNALSEPAKIKLDQLQTDLKAQVKLVEDATESQAKIIERLSAVEQIVWPNSVGQEPSLTADPNSRSKKKLLDLFSPTEAEQGGATQAEIEAAMQLRGRLQPTVAVSVQEMCTESSSEDCALTVPANHAKGLIYRSPVPAQLLICQVGSVDECSVVGASEALVSATFMAPQLGELRMLPMTNGMYQSNVLKVSFRENGGVASLNYDERVARGKVLSAAVSSSMSDLLAYRDARQVYRDKQASDAKAEDAAKKKADLDQLDAEISRLEKLQKIATLKANDATSSASADTQAETARLNAQIALLEARKKLKDAEDALAKAQQ